MQPSSSSRQKWILGYGTVRRWVWVRSHECGPWVRSHDAAHGTTTAALREACNYLAGPGVPRRCAARARVQVGTLSSAHVHAHASQPKYDMPNVCSCSTDIHERDTATICLQAQHGTAEGAPHKHRGRGGGGGGGNKSGGQPWGQSQSSRHAGRKEEPWPPQPHESTCTPTWC